MTRTPRAARRAAAALAGALVLAPLALLTAPAVADDPTHVPVRTDGPGTEHYVAFGDSFVSGPGIAPQRAGGCSRSEKNFPSLVASTLDVASFTDASCSGATTAHFTTAQGSNPPQLDALSERTTLVTFGTMGGNDIGLIGLAQECAEGSCVPAAGTDPLAEKFDTLRTSLVDNLAAARVRAPKAEFMVIGYGTYMPDRGCPATFLGALSEDEFDYVQGQIDRLSDLLYEVAADAGAHFVDQRDVPGALDHTVCAPFADQWIRGIWTKDPLGGPSAPVDGAVFHPSTAGMAATAAHVVAEVAEMRTKGEPPTEQPMPTPRPTPKPVVTPAPTKAQRLAALKRKAATAKVTASCQGSRRSGSVTLRVRGGAGTVKAVTFRAGSKKVAVDRRSPFATKKKSATLRTALKKRSAKVRAVVTFREHGVSVKRTVVLKKRPSCLR